MNLLDRKEQEEFFLDYLTRVLPQKAGIRVMASSYEEEWSALRYTTSIGPLVVRINDVQKPQIDVSHRTGFVARLLAEIGGRAPEEFIPMAKGLFEGVYADFSKPIICPGGAEIFAWDSTRETWPRPFYIRRWVEGPNLAVLPRTNYFYQAGRALRRFHAIRFKNYYASFKAVAKKETSPAKELFAIGKALNTVEPLVPLLTIRALGRLEDDSEGVAAGLVSNSFFGNNILIDNLGRVCVPDWERAGIGDLAQDFFPLKYWTVVDRRSGWYMPDASLFAACGKGYGVADFQALSTRPAWRYLEAQWLLQRLGAASRRWAEGGLREPYPEPDFYVGCLRRLLDA